jgi:hypothetical protein
VLAPGIYGPFALNKGLTIRGNNARIDCQGAPIQFQIPAGQRADVERLLLVDGVLPIGNRGCPTRVTGGTVHFEDCQFSFGAGVTLDIAGADVILDRCTLTGFASTFGSQPVANGPAVQCGGGSLTLRDCTLQGAQSSCSSFGCGVAGFPATAGLRLTSGVAQVERSVIQGGNSSPGVAGGDGIAILGGVLRCSDSTLSGGNPQLGIGGQALRNQGGQVAELRNTQLLPGAGAVASSGPNNPNASLLRMRLSPPWTRGVTSTLTVAGAAGDFYLIYLAPDTSPVVVSPVIEPVWASTGTFVHGGVLSAAGSDAVAVAVPNVPALQHLPFSVQAFGGTSPPLRASTVAGGIVR